MVYLTRDSLPVIGLLWNPRMLPWVYLMRYLMMMIGAVEVAGALVNWLRNRPAPRGPRRRHAVADRRRHRPRRAGDLRLRVPDAARRQQDRRPVRLGPDPLRCTGCPTPAATAGRRTTSAATRPSRCTPSTTTSCRRWPTSGKDPEHGCGRALWEIDNRDGVGNGKYGTTMALMLLPFWTDGCIASMEGLYFEASGTTPYHFLTAAAMSDRRLQPGAPAALRRQRRRRRRRARPATSASAT